MDEETFERKIFVQEHSFSKECVDKPKGKTLLILNLPPFIAENELERSFGSFGPIENVQISDSGTENAIFKSVLSKHFNVEKSVAKFKTAYVIFKSTKTLQKALNASEIDLFDNEISSLNCGVKKWKNEYETSFIDEKQLTIDVSKYIDAFEAREQQERNASRQTEVDEDGWVTVKRGKAGGGFEQKESIIKALEEKIEEGKKKKQFKNFYTFQIRESKQKHIFSLRKRFAEDKLKIEALKKTRRFKPF